MTHAPRLAPAGPSLRLSASCQRPLDPGMHRSGPTQRGLAAAVRRLATAALLLGAGLALACSGGSSSTPVASPSSAPVARTASAGFGTLPDGRAVQLVTLRNKAGVEVAVTGYGGIIVSIKVPDRAGRFEDVVLGHDQLAGYLSNPTYFGCIVGRYANRIAKGTFTLDGTSYRLATNNGANHLHGGTKGWDQALWRASTFEKDDAAGVELALDSPDGDEGYPGAVAARVTYTLNDASELAIDYEATTDKPTVVNLTQHSYFNLSGGTSAQVLDHELEVAADRYTPVDEGLIPTGELAPVEGTPFDFRKAAKIGARIDADHVQIRRGKGYDHNFVLNRAGDGLAPAAKLYEPGSGRTLEVHTTEPGLQFYSGNFLDGTIRGKSGRVYGHRAGLCLETQHFPDSPNRPDFPSTVLRPGQVYRSRTVLRFGTR